MAESRIPVGTTVYVDSNLAEGTICQVIGHDVDEHTGEVLYKLGHITERTGLLRRWPRKTSLDHWVSRSRLEVMQ